MWKIDDQQSVGAVSTRAHVYWISNVIGSLQVVRNYFHRVPELSSFMCQVGQDIQQVGGT